MLKRALPIRRRFLYPFLGVAALLALVLALTVSCAGSSSGTGPAAETAPPAGAGLLGSGPFYAGPASLEERIAGADVIARVRLRSVSSGAELRELTRGGPLKHLAALEHRFDVLEYLKGSGDGELLAVVNELFDHETAERAAEAGAALLAARDTRWDGREAIIFLWNGLQQSDRYLLGSIITDWGYFGDGYTVASPHDKAWLPAASDGGASGSASTSRAPGGSGAKASSAGAQRFLLDEPGSAPSGETGARGASGQAATASTITLADMKAKIAQIEREAVAGGGSEAYRECLYHKYEWERQVRYWKEARGGVYYSIREDEGIASGLPTGSLAFTSGSSASLLQKYGQTPPSSYGKDRLAGRDEDLFHPQWPAVVRTARPLPAGEYRFYFAYQPKRYVLCDALPEDELKRTEVFVAVTAPAGMVHEAFFDPADLTPGAGFSASSGVLEPAGFSIGGTAASITGLKWQSGSVVLTLAPYASLSGHTLDFIALDGSVDPSLPVSSVTADSAAGTLTWAVPVQPWQDGDQLMLRIRAAGTPPTPTGKPLSPPDPA